MFTWKDLEYKVVGRENIDMDRLKEITVYRVSLLNYGIKTLIFLSLYRTQVRLMTLLKNIGRS